MQLRFFAGIEDQQIHPQPSDTDACAHYAYCLQQAITSLSIAASEEERRTALNQFEKTMKESPATREMFNEFESQFALLMSNSPLPEMKYLIDCLKGMPVGKEKYYISYTSL